MAVPAAPAQRVPSRVVMHALHAMLLGTTCSLLVLTEERRRRIRSAQTMVDNARRLEEYKRHQYHSRRALTTSGSGSGSGSSKGSDGMAEVTIKSTTMESTGSVEVAVERGEEMPNDAEVGNIWRESGESGSGSCGEGREGWTRGEAPLQPLQQRSPQQDEHDDPWSAFIDKSKPSEPNTQPTTKQTTQQTTEQAQHQQEKDLADSADSPSLEASLPPLAPLDLSRFMLPPRPKTETNTSNWSLGRLESNPLIDAVWQRAAAHDLASSTSDAPVDEQQQQIFQKRVANPNFWAEVTVEPAPGATPEEDVWDQIEADLQMGRVDDAVQAFRDFEDAHGVRATKTNYWVGMLQAANLDELAIDEWARGYNQLHVSGPRFKVACQLLTRQFDSIPTAKGGVVLPRRYGGPCPERVLETVFQVAAASKAQPPAIQVTRLLDAFHDRHQDFSRLKDLYTRYRTRILATDMPSLPLRCMLNHAAQVGDVEAVKVLTAEFQACMGPAQRAMLKTKLLLAQAVRGDWDGVRAGFVAARQMGGPQMLHPQRQDLSEVLRAYTAKHTAKEVEYFLRKYVFDLGLVLGPGMVSSVAQMYSRRGDVEGLGIWIRVCIHQGYGKSRELMGHILDACVDHWKYGRNSLMHLLKLISDRTEKADQGGGDSGIVLPAAATQSRSAAVAAVAVGSASAGEQMPLLSAPEAEAAAVGPGQPKPSPPATSQGTEKATAPETAQKTTAGLETAPQTAPTTGQKTTPPQIPQTPQTPQTALPESPSPPVTRQTPQTKAPLEIPTDERLDGGYHRLAQLYLDKLGRVPRSWRGSVSSLLLHKTNGELDNDISCMLWKQCVAREFTPALEMYNQAMAQGLVPSDSTVSMAMTAAVERDGSDSSLAMDIIRQAWQRNAKIKGTLSKYMMYQLQAIDQGLNEVWNGGNGDGDGGVSADGQDGGPSAAAVQTIMAVMRKFIEAGLPIPSTALNRATRMCLRLQQYRTALQLVQLAAVMQAQESGRDVFTSRTVDILANQFNFSNLVFAFTASRRHYQLEWVLARLEQGAYPWTSDNVVLNALKRAERRLLASAESALTEYVREQQTAVLNRTRAALDYVKAVRMFNFAHGREARRERRHVNAAIIRALATDKAGIQTGMHVERQWTSS